MKRGALEALKSIPRSKSIATLLSLAATGTNAAVTGQIPTQFDFNSIDDYHEGLLRIQFRSDGGSGATPTAVGAGATFTLKYAWSDDLIGTLDIVNILQTANASLVCGLPNAISVKASGTITFTGLPVAGETVTVGTRAGVLVTYKFVPALTGAPFEILIGASAALTAQNLRAAIADTALTAGVTRGNSGPHPEVTATDNGAGVITVTARGYGADYNSVSLAKAATNVSVSGAILTGGSSAGSCQFNTDPFVHGGRYLYVWFDRSAFAVNAQIDVTAKLQRL